MVEVNLWGGLVPFADGRKRISVEAGTVREMLDRLTEMYPGLQEPMEAGVAVVIDGVVWRDDRSRPLPEGAEVYLMRRIAGG